MADGYVQFDHGFLDWSRVFPLTVFEDAGQLAAAAADHLRSLFAMSSEEPVAIMLSGGSTPLAAYRLLEAQAEPARDNVHLFMSDERMVPPDDERNNHHAVLPMLAAAGLPPGRQLRVDTTLEPDAAAARFDGDLLGLLERGGRLAGGLLGIGGDGHTAGLFEPGHWNAAGNRLAVRVDRPDGMQGVSVTPALLEQVERIIFMVSGSGKRSTLAELLESPASLVAGLAVADCKKVEVWLDKAAYPY